MSRSFVLIEGDTQIGDDVEALIYRRFPMITLDRLALSDTKVAGEIDWASYDVVLIDGTALRDESLLYLNTIKQQTLVSYILFISDTTENGVIACQQGADGCFNSQKSMASLGAKIDDLIELKKKLKLFPLQLTEWSLQEVLHDGANSIVYKATDREGNRVAIKRYKYDITNISEASREAFIASLNEFSKIKTPRLVQIYSSGISDQAFYQVMEYMQGGSLQESLAAHGRLPLPHALTWFFEIVYALHVVHEAGLLHRDLKTANIMLREDGTLALNDYGAAASVLLESGFIAEDEIYCTPYYVSPERALDEPCDVRSDIYSLGIIFYELLMGEKPYYGSTEMELLMQHVIAPIPVFPPEYAGYQSLLDKMLAKNASDRLQKVIDVGSYLGG